MNKHVLNLLKLVILMLVVLAANFLLDRLIDIFLVAIIYFSGMANYYLSLKIKEVEKNA